jgi:hypothetical protein
MNSGSSAFISSGGQSVDRSATALAQSKSRPFHRDVGAGALEHDDGFDATALLERLVDIGLERYAASAAQPFIGGDDKPAVAVGDRPARASGEKPAKTIEWIAPMRAQASMATAASGTIGR